jgi:competence protein ComFC
LPDSRPSPDGHDSRLGNVWFTARESVFHMSRVVVRTIFPEVCAGCGVSGTWMCDECTGLLRRVAPERACARCGQPEQFGRSRCRRCDSWNAALSASRSVLEFDGPGRLAVHRLKYRNEPARAEWCAKQIAALIVDLEWTTDVMIPVPLHHSRYRERGYNQSEHICRWLAKILDTDVSSALIRNRSTASQVGLGATERVTNVRGAFQSSQRLDGMDVMLVDDVITTGSTLSECAVACVRGGATRVRAVTLATGL